MAPSYQLRQAIDAARAGRSVEARDLLLRIVEQDPKNEAAWIWLSGLVDSLDDKVVACENALTINPHNEKMRLYLKKLQKQQEETLKQKQANEVQELMIRAKMSAQNGDVPGAFRLAEQAAQKDDGCEDAWLLVAEFSPNVYQRVAALERATAIRPSNADTLALLKAARRWRDDPWGAAAHYEQLGKFAEALKVYNDVASRTKDSREFDRIYRNIARIEGLQREKIQYVAPRTSILRLAIGWPLLYFFLVLMQVGLNPFVHPALHLWLGLPLVALGSFLLSLSEVRSTHAVWEKLFLEDGDGSGFARSITAAAGWMLVIFPHLLLLIDSINRLRTFSIPPEPF